MLADYALYLNYHSQGQRRVEFGVHQRLTEAASTHAPPPPVACALAQAPAQIPAVNTLPRPASRRNLSPLLSRGKTMSHRRPKPVVRCVALLATAAASLATANVAVAQNNYYAAIAYSQSTGRIGFTVRRARTEQEAQRFAEQNCGAPDAKAYMWGGNQWVAIATVDDHPGTAGFGRGATDAEAQQKALAESRSRRPRQRLPREALRSLPRPEALGCCNRSLRRNPSAPASAATAGVKPTGFLAAIAFSPSTGKIGHTAGRPHEGRSRALAIKSCAAPDAKLFMWGDQWW